MRSRSLIQAIACILLTACSFKALAQEESESLNGRSDKRFRMGLYIGAYFPNGHTADVYDGYGFDGEGRKNGFLNSLMYQRIVLDYGGGYGQQDLIAEALGVGHDDWSFNEGDMPENMVYSPAFLFGFNTKLRVGKTDGILFNVNVAKLTISGNFTLTINNPSPGGQTPGYSNYRIFSIKGTERRLGLQLGYQRVIGNNEKMNFLYEGGAICTITKFSEELIEINDLIIDLTSNYNLAGYGVTPPQNLLGVGLGMFAGFGVNIDTGSKWLVQLIYSPSYENLYYGGDPGFSFQQWAGLRFMY